MGNNSDTLTVDSPPAALWAFPGLLDECDVCGLIPRSWIPEADLPVVNDWLRSRRSQDGDGGGPAAHVYLPPCGVVVEEENDRPVAVLFCFEPVGVQTAFVDCAVTRPGLTVKQAERALLLAFLEVVECSGTGFNPPMRYEHFIFTVPDVLVARMKRHREFQHLAGSQFLFQRPEAGSALNQEYPTTVELCGGPAGYFPDNH